MPMFELELMDEYFAGVSSALFVFLWWLQIKFLARLIATYMTVSKPVVNRVTNDL